MSSITTHVLDTAIGRPASGVPLILAKGSGGGWTTIGRGTTDLDGRCKSLLKEGGLKKGTYRLTFGTAAYFKRTRQAAFYPSVSVVFTVRDSRHHHVPLLISPWGYSTYRGS
ncbi:MAG: hydroxyisourate hydrolase [Elusimicrobiota bacterium]|nr:MAG: hydroxyisourate hydrolase [Elusimicrobiota bacterium]